MSLLIHLLQAKVQQYKRAREEAEVIPTGIGWLGDGMWKLWYSANQVVSADRVISIGLQLISGGFDTTSERILLRIVAKVGCWLQV